MKEQLKHPSSANAKKIRDKHSYQFSSLRPHSAQDLAYNNFSNNYTVNKLVGKTRHFSFTYIREGLIQQVMVILFFE